MSTGFLRHVVGETEGRAAITFTYVREHGKLFPAGLSVVSVHQPRRKTSKEHHERLVVRSVRAVLLGETKWAANFAV